VFATRRHFSAISISSRIQNGGLTTNQRFSVCNARAV